MQRAGKIRPYASIFIRACHECIERLQAFTGLHRDEKREKREDG
jgi:hypothetical protein